MTYSEQEQERAMINTRIRICEEEIARLRSKIAAYKKQLDETYPVKCEDTVVNMFGYIGQKTGLYDINRLMPLLFLAIIKSKSWELLDNYFDNWSVMNTGIIESDVSDYYTGKGIARISELLDYTETLTDHEVEMIRTIASTINTDFAGFKKDMYGTNELVLSRASCKIASSLIIPGVKNTVKLSCQCIKYDTVVI